MIQGNDSKIFPATSHSRDVLNILINECKSLGVILFCNQHVRSITRVGAIFEVRGLDKIYRSTNLVIATGGCSYPTTGSTGDGYRFAKDLGHSIVEIGPSLTPVYAKEYPFANLAGLSFSDISISLYRHKKIKYQKGDVLLTHQGLSGPAILDLSRYIRVGDTLKISFISPDRQKELEKWLIDKSRIEGNSGARSALLGLSNSDSLSPRLIKRIFEISGIPLDIRCAHLTKEMRGQLIDNLTGFPIVVSDLGGFNIAMVTKGGIELNEVNPKRMESKLIKGLYFIGEVLDIDGDTGGYNLQAAFSTGMLAARSIINSYLEIKN
jgi:predicted Rossmann fold flavoprotein